ncbi:hypothetical protein ACFSTC_01365 [Nonomuraea ferruginea]
MRRHSGTTRATVRLRGDSQSLRLDIIGEGKGFSLEDVPGHRRGIRESVRGRMTRIGGTATVVSAEGEGTRVRLEWPALAMTDAAGERTGAQLKRGLRIATLLVAVAIAGGLGGANLMRHWDVYEWPVAQVVALAMLAAVLACEAVLLVRRRPWNRLRWAAVAVVLAASALSYATLPDGRTSTTTDWIFGAANWAGFTVLLDRPLRTSAGFLAAHELVALLHLFLFGEPDRQALARFATGSVTVIGFPLCVAVGAAVLRGLSAAATTAQRELERVRVVEAVAAASHRRRQQRFTELSASTIPLLEGFADNSLRPDDPAVQRLCAIEAARMRRLFAETDTVADPLVHELRHCADVADRKGVEVELDTRGQWPTPPWPSGAISPSRC